MDSPRFTLRQLEIYLAVASNGSISRAAEQMHCSPSAASASIIELERALRTQLCIRKKSQGVVLTPQGRFMQSMAQQLMFDAADLAAMLDDEAEQLAGVLRLGCYAPLASSFLPPLLKAFVVRYPDVAIEILEESQDLLATRMVNGDLDVSLMYDRPTDPALEAIHVLSRRPYVLLNSDHRFAGRQTVALTELTNDSLILLDLPPSKETTLSWFRECEVRPTVRWQTHDIELLRSLVAGDLGYAILLQRQRDSRALDGSRLCTIEIDPPVRPVEVYLVHRHSRVSPRRVQAFLDLAKREMAAPAAWTGAIPVQTTSGSGYEVEE